MSKENINIQEFLTRCGLDEPLYPGKRIVKKKPQPGQFKSYCVVFDWSDPARIKVVLKPGLTGHDLSEKEVSKYPIYLQMQTFYELVVDEDSTIH